MVVCCSPLWDLFPGRDTVPDNSTDRHARTFGAGESAAGAGTLPRRIVTFVLIAIQGFRYALMEKCWNKSPDIRPNFIQIREELRKLLNSQDEQYGYLPMVLGDDLVSFCLSLPVHFFFRWRFTKSQSSKSKNNQNYDEKNNTFLFIWPWSQFHGNKHVSC